MADSVCHLTSLNIYKSMYSVIMIVFLGDVICQEPLINPDAETQNDNESGSLKQSKNGSLRNRNVEQPLDSLDEVLHSVDY